MNQKKFTHRVAVNAFLIFQDKFLLLKRANEPFIWAPPGGHLDINENPVLGLQREVKEETGLQIRIYQPVTTWFGDFGSSRLLSVDYLCTSRENNITLSWEHNDYRWLSIDDLTKNKKIYLNTDRGFHLDDFQLAWRTYLLNEKRLADLGP
jgi:8-oxo-dGTP diphosphatase